MRIHVQGKIQSCRTLGRYLDFNGYELSAADPYLTVTLDNHDTDLIVIDGQDCEFERLCINRIAALTPTPIALKRQGGVQSDQAIHITFPAKAADVVERGVLAAIMVITKHSAAFGPHVSSADLEKRVQQLEAAREGLEKSVYNFHEKRLEALEAQTARKSSRWVRLWQAWLVLLLCWPLWGQTAVNPGIATAAAPTYGEGERRPISFDLAGNARVTLAGGSVTVSGVFTTTQLPAALVGGRLSVDGSGVTQPVSGTFWQATQPVSGTFFQATQPVSAVSWPLPTGAAQEHVTAGGYHSTRLTDGTSFYKATTPADTQPVSAASLPLPTDAATQTTLALIKAKTDNLDVALSTRTKPADTQIVDGSGVTQPVSAASLPLPSGAATALRQDTGNTSLASIDGKIPSSPATDRATAGSPFSTRLSNGSAFYNATTPSDTQPISAASLPLPSLAATSTKQSDGTQKTQVVDGSGNVIGSTGNALDINIKSGNPTSITATQGTGTNLHTVVDSGSITATATDLDIRNLSQTQDAVVVFGSDDGGTTKRVVKTDSGGAVQVDVESLPSVTIATFPDNEPFDLAKVAGTTTALGNGAADAGTQRVTPSAETATSDYQSTAGTSTAPGVGQIATGQTAVLTGASADGKTLVQVEAWCSCAYRLLVYTVSNDAESGDPIIVGGGPLYAPYVWSAQSRVSIALGSSSGLDAFRAKLTNMASAGSADAYVIFRYF